MSSASHTGQAPTSPRRRATSRRAINTSRNILDAAERLFAEHGYDGTSVRDIASAAGTPIASISFHHVGKETLFERAVERRASELSQLRLDALADLKTRDDPVTLEGVLGAFFRPYLEKAGAGDPQWLAYARLVAMVSADIRWHHISERCFDPTAGQFIAEIATLFPEADPRAIATSFVFSVSAMLSLSTSTWRIEALSSSTVDPALMERLADELIRFCEAGMGAALEHQG